MEKYIKIEDYEKQEKTKISLYKTTDNRWYITDFSVNNGLFNKVGDIIDVYKNYIVFKYNGSTYFYDFKRKKELYKTGKDIQYFFKNNCVFISNNEIPSVMPTYILNLETGNIIEDNILYLDELDKSERYVLYSKSDESLLFRSVFDTITCKTVYICLNLHEHYYNLKLNGNYCSEIRDNKHITFQSLENEAIKYTCTTADYKNPTLCGNDYVILDKNKGIIRDLNNDKTIDLKTKIIDIKNDLAFCHLQNSKRYSVLDLKSENVVYEFKGKFQIHDNYIGITEQKSIYILSINDFSLRGEIKIKKDFISYAIVSNYLIVYKKYNVKYDSIENNVVTIVIDLYSKEEIYQRYPFDTQVYEIKNDKLLHFSSISNTSNIYSTHHPQNKKEFKGELDFSKNGLVLSDGCIVDVFNDVFSEDLINNDEIDLMNIDGKKYYSIITIEGESSLSNYSKTIEAKDKESLKREKYNAICDIGEIITGYKSEASDKKLKKTMFK